MTNDRKERARELVRKLVKRRPGRAPNVWDAGEDIAAFATSEAEKERERILDYGITKAQRRLDWLRDRQTATGRRISLSDVEAAISTFRALKESGE